MNGKNVKYFYSTQEQWLLKFFMIWTAKEAFLKADGSGKIFVKYMILF
jgi:phosphopantetheinyl transferase